MNQKLLLLFMLFICQPGVYAQNDDSFSELIRISQYKFSGSQSLGELFKARGSNSSISPLAQLTACISHERYMLTPLAASKSANEGELSRNTLGMFLFAGYGKLRYNIESSELYKFDYVYTKGGGASLEIPIMALNEKFSVYNEIGFSINKSEKRIQLADTVGGDPVNNFYDIKLLFSPSTLTVANIVRYTLTPGDFKYYLAAGIYNSFVISATNLKETDRHKNGKIINFQEQLVPDPAIHGLMLLASTGFNYKNIGFELRFDPGRNYSNKLDYAVYMPTFIAVLHVQFTR